mgnify:CR=1 FL=1
MCLCVNVKHHIIEFKINKISPKSKVQELRVLANQHNLSRKAGLANQHIAANHPIPPPLPLQNYPVPHYFVQNCTTCNPTFHSLHRTRGFEFYHILL